MIIKRKFKYTAAWLIYIAFSWGLFPLFNITALLCSIPLSMAGGWLYGYRGAALTTALTVPYHFLLLWFRAEDQALIIESVNVFGISSQLSLSVLTAYVRSIQDRYDQMNSSLEKIVEERTADLRLLTEYLLDMEEAERKKTTASLLIGPHESLKSMLGISTLLVRHLAETNHAGLSQAKTIDTLIGKAATHLQSLGHVTESISTAPADFEKTVIELSNQLATLSGATVNVLPNGGWERMENNITTHLYQIIHEALTNAVRHAEASNITIGVKEEPDAITVYVQNDGKPMLDSSHEGMGLPLMRYRASSIGASLSIDGGPDQDTILKCRMPKSAMP
jgi:signal transduction histidine kinase